ncbi:MAG: cytochrome c [Variovorax sp.]|nr:cytochrome c [Variovorax sp.]
MRRLAGHGRTLAAALALAGAMGAAAAQDVMQEGRKLFTTAVPACALCHTLRDAGATGEIGPALDELKPDAARVEKAIRNGIGQMPPFTTLTDAQVKLLAQYVARATGAAP